MSNETEQKPMPHRTRIEVSVEFDEILDQPQQPPAVVCCKELPVRLYEAAVKVIDSEPKLIDLAVTTTGTVGQLILIAGPRND